MAKLHSKRRGKSSSKLPGRKSNKPDFVEMSVDDAKALVRKLYRLGTSTAEIGLILRDQYGVPSFKGLTGITMVKFLREENLYSRFPEDLLNLLRKAVGMYHHLQDYKKDVHNKVKYEHVLSKIHRLTKYYKAKGYIPQDWKYSADEAEALIR